MPNNNPTGINQFTKGGGTIKVKSARSGMGGLGGKNKSSKVVMRVKDEKPKIPKSAKLIGRARINRTNFSNPDWVKRGGWSKSQVDKIMKETEFLLHMKKSK